MIFAIIVAGLYLGREKGEIKSEGVKRKGVRVESTYRGDDSRQEKSGESSPGEESGDSPLGEIEEENCND